MQPSRTDPPPELDRLLRSGQLRRADALPAPAGGRPLSTGVAAIDAALGGGLLRGQLTEIVAPASAGGTALLRAALGAATRAGELCALIDPEDAFDPRPLDEDDAAAALDLRRLLWVRPPTLALALRAAEIALEARFALVALDLGELGEGSFAARRPSFAKASAAGFEPPSAPRVFPLFAGAPSSLANDERRTTSDQTTRIERTDRDLSRAGLPRQLSAPRAGGSPWARLSRRAERQGGALLVLSRAPQLGPFSAAAVELQRRAARWEGQPHSAGRLLQGAHSSCAVVRLRHGAPSAPLPLSLQWA